MYVQCDLEGQMLKTDRHQQHIPAVTNIGVVSIQHIQYSEDSMVKG